MLTHLSIHNYALIASLELELSSGFTVMTGETGAGKSILLGALALLMGAKAEARVITDGEERCYIEGTFLHEDKTYLIRRELSRSGRSRSFVNDELVSMAELKALSTKLIDIHSQHQNLLLNDSTFQISVLDELAQNAERLSAYQEAYNEYTGRQTALQRLRAEAEKAREQSDYINYQLTQLREAALQDEELEALQQEEYTLSHAEQLRGQLAEALKYLDGDGGSVLTSLHSIKITEASAELQQRIDSAYIELKDIHHEISRMYDTLADDPIRLAEVQERLLTLQTLLRKFHCADIPSLIAVREQLQEQSSAIDTYDERISAAESAAQEAYQAMVQQADRLTASRKDIAGYLEQRLIEIIGQLGIRHPQVEVRISPAAEFTPLGHDEVTYYFAANLGQSLQPMSAVASGGEIARIMLGLKALTAHSMNKPTLIFDEVDTGISGDAATQMAQIMRQMAAHRQVIAITHLPQIASAGEHHIKVYKEDAEGHTRTQITQLNEAQRVSEIATLLSGTPPTPAALANAEELIRSLR